MEIYEELKSLLPTLAARLSALSTLALLPLAFQAPPFLQPWLWPKTTAGNLVPYQLGAVVAVGLIGSLITFLIIRYATPKSFWENNP
jgi:hypothetical protein